jgi:hypothetical protein
MHSWPSRFVRSSPFPLHRLTPLSLSQQALTRSPYKRQLLEAQKFWSQNTNKFQSTVNKDFVDIFPLIPRVSRVTVRAFHRLQSFVRGNAIRRQVIRGIGNRKDIKKRMFARSGILFAEKHPVLIRAKADWMGQVASLLLFDVVSEVTKHIKLKIPFTPVMELGPPRKLRLHLSWERIPSKSELSKSQDINDVLDQEVDDASILSNPDDTADDFSDKIILTLKFVDDLNRAYMQRKVMLILTENPSETLLLQNRTEDNKGSSSDLFREVQYRLENPDADSRPRSRIEGGISEEGEFEGDDLSRTPRGGEEVEEAKDNQKAIARTVLKDIYINNYFEKHVETNIIATEVTRFGLIWHLQPFLIRILNDRDVTQINIFSVRNNMNLVFLMHRENITRSVNLKRRCEKLLSFMSQHERLQRYLPSPALSKGLKDLEESHLTAEDLQARERFNFFQGKNCFIKPLPEGNGVTIILADNNTDPVIGDLYERCETQTENQVDKEKFTRLAVSKSLFRDSFAFAFQNSRSRAGNDEFQTVSEHLESFVEDDDNARTPKRRDPIMDAIKTATQIVSGKEYVPPPREDGVVVVTVDKPLEVAAENKVEPLLPLLQPEPEIELAQEAAKSPLVVAAAEEKQLTVAVEEEPVPKKSDKKGKTTKTVKIKSPEKTPAKERKPKDKKKEPEPAKIETIAPFSPPKDEPKTQESPVVVESKAVESVEAAEPSAEAKEVLVPALDFESPSLKKTKSLLAPTESPVPEQAPVDFSSPGQALKNAKSMKSPKKSSKKKSSSRNLNEPPAEVMLEFQAMAESEGMVPLAEEDSMFVSVYLELVDHEPFYEQAAQTLLAECMQEALPELLNDCLLAVADERMELLEEELCHLSMDTFLADFFEEALHAEAEAEVARLVEEHAREVAEGRQMIREDEASAAFEAAEKRRLEEERVRRELQRLEEERRRREEEERRLREEAERREREFRLQQVQLLVPEVLVEVFEAVYMRSEDWNILALPEPPKEDTPEMKAFKAQVEALKKSQVKYFKIKSGQPLPSNNRMQTRNTLTPLLNRAVKRQPLSSSQAVISGGELRSPVSVQDLRPQEIRTAFAFDSADDLKKALENMEASSLGTGVTQSLEQYMTNLHKQPSWINVHKGPKKPKKIQFNSTFNALYHSLHTSEEELLHHEADDNMSRRQASLASQQESLEGSIAKSLSSTSWSAGRFSIEKNVVEATNIGAAGAANPATSASPSASRSSRPRKGKRDSTSPEAGLYIQSVKQVQRLGYVPTMENTGTKTAKKPWAYAAHWQRLLTDFLATHAVGSLRQSQNPQVGFDAAASQLSDSEDSLAASSSLRLRSASGKLIHRPPFWELRKKIKALMKAIASNSQILSQNKNLPIGANPRLKSGMLSIEEIICALAETRGSVGEVITRLSDHNLEFISEIQLVCSALNVKSMVCALPGGAELFEIELQAIRQAADPPELLSPSSRLDSSAFSSAGGMKRRGSSERIALILRKEKALQQEPGGWSAGGGQLSPSNDDQLSVLSDDHDQPAFESVSRHSTGPLHHRNLSMASTAASVHSQLSNTSDKLSAAASAGSSNPLLLVRPSSLPSLRDQAGEHTHLVFPHLQLSQVTPTVKKRASFITMQTIPAKPAGQAWQSVAETADGSSSIKSPPPLPAEEKRAFFPIGHSHSSDGASTLTGPSLLPSSLLPSPRSQNSITSVGHHSLATNALKKSFRVQQQLVDGLYGEHQRAQPVLAIMTRRDAIRAKQEETLLKSEKVYIREAIEKKHRLSPDSAEAPLLSPPPTNFNQTI